MESATRVAAWHLKEAQRFLGELALPAELANPARLETWLLDYCQRHGNDAVPTREIQRLGLGGLREKAAIAQAVAELAELGRARAVQDGKKKAIQINPALLKGGAREATGSTRRPGRQAGAARPWGDDRRLCIECRHCASVRSCGRALASGLGHKELGELATKRQRCPAFAPAISTEGAGP